MFECALKGQESKKKKKVAKWNNFCCLLLCLVYCERLRGGEHGEDSEEEAGACGESFRREKHTEP